MLKTYEINLGRFGEFEGSDYTGRVLKITETENPLVYKMNLLTTEENGLISKHTLVPDAHSETYQTVTFGEGLV